MPWQNAAKCFLSIFTLLLFFQEAEGACSLPPASAELEGAVAGEVLEVSGKKIVLTEAERQNPEIAAKYK